MKIIGIDPGNARLGFAILELSGTAGRDKIKLIQCGVIETSKNLDECFRLKEIREDLLHILEAEKPSFCSVEKLFFFKNPKTIVPVAQARGVILEVMAKLGVEVYEYTPLEVKKIITGDGRADKNTVAEMIYKEFDIQEKISPDDAVDAVAIALTFCRNDLFKLSFKS